MTKWPLKKRENDGKNPLWSSGFRGTMVTMVLYPQTNPPGWPEQRLTKIQSSVLQIPLARLFYICFFCHGAVSSSLANSLFALLVFPWPWSVWLEPWFIWFVGRNMTVFWIDCLLNMSQILKLHALVWKCWWLTRMWKCQGCLQQNKQSVWSGIEATLPAARSVARSSWPHENQNMNIFAHVYLGAWE